MKLIVVLLCTLTGCMTYPNESRLAGQIVPAVEFTKAVKERDPSQFSIFDVEQQKSRVLDEEARAQLVDRAPLQFSDSLARQGADATPKDEAFNGDPRYLKDGLVLHHTVSAPKDLSRPEITEVANDRLVPPRAAMTPPGPNPGSSAPYYLRQMGSNPSLWPDEAQANSLFRDMRAFQPMDLVTILVNDKSEGRKKAETDAESKFSILAAIQNFFGEEAKWTSNNASLDPTNLINATTNSKFEGEGETKREGTLKSRLSAVILEVLPNGILRIEGTKIISVDHEEEIMVVSGLARPRDIDAQNQLDSSRIANMRVDFYGRGVVAEQTFPGWASRIFRYVWPF